MDGVVSDEGRPADATAGDGTATDAAPTGVCPSCGEAPAAGARFCESCGAPLTSAPPTPTEPAPAPAEAAAAPRPPSGCPECGGTVAADGYCEQCGARAPVGRDHLEEQPAPHVAGVTDVGVRRRRNEDALALGAVGEASVLVVCDGVGSAPDSDVASQAAASTARDVLVAGAADVAADDAGAWSRLLVAAGHRADDAARAAVDDAASRQDPPSCTFVAAVVTPSLVVAAWLGDSRVYWLPDDATPEQLTEDDSLASELVAGGASREAAEQAPGAHSITRWLGADAEDTTARTVATRPGGPGWVLACSDGLWNYVSAPDDVAALLQDTQARVGADPVVLSRELVTWAKAAGGHDNVTVALARVPGGGATAPAPDARTEDAGTVPTTRRRPAGSLPTGAGDPAP